MLYGKCVKDVGQLFMQCFHGWVGKRTKSGIFYRKKNAYF